MGLEAGFSVANFVENVSAVAFVVLLLLLLGDIVYVRHRTRDSVSLGGSKGGAMKRLRDEPWYARVALLLAVVWAVWLLAFVVWAWNIPEWDSDNFYFGYTAWSVAALVIVAIGVVEALRRPGWGAIGGGLLVTSLGAFWSDNAVTELRHWGELVEWLNEDRGSPWVPLDSLDLVPYWVLLVAGVLLLVGGVVHVLHPTHNSTPHAAT